MINPEHKLSIRKQCFYLSLNRSYVNYKAILLPDDTTVANAIAEIYRQYPVYGCRRISQELERSYGITVNNKRVLRVMRELRTQAIYPKPCTTKRNQDHAVFPYLLRGMAIHYPHQVWQTDITYIRTPHGFMYLNALIDVFSRAVVGWNLSNTLNTASCLRSLEQAIQSFGLPTIVNTQEFLAI